MTTTSQLRTNERLLFQGDVTLIQGMAGIKEGDGLITNQRCTLVFPGLNFVAEKGDIASVSEQKHGFGTKILVQHKNGLGVTVLAPNMRGLKNALYALADLPVDEAAFKQPELSAVKNTTAWLAALGPIWADLSFLILAAMLGWNLNAALSFIGFIKIILFKVAVIYLFLRIDHVKLQQQGYNTVALGIVGPEKFPFYLFSRAKAFGHGKGYAITWCVLAALEILWLL
jgi:hypothetical protein